MLSKVHKPKTKNDLLSALRNANIRDFEVIEDFEGGELRKLFEKHNHPSKRTTVILIHHRN